MVAGRKAVRAGREALEAQREQAKADIRAQALQRHARIKQGRPAMCSGTAAAAQSRLNSGIVWDRKAKVIFDSIEDAEAFAKVVYGLEGKLQTAYHCEFSRRGHVHLTSDDE